ncbi:agglutinin-2-like [Miscanthus floridulus]|uniref:agglutinin-2-like n=1 Tax=Miscanthus floridulus TaxID=154761 RepID=UPI00345813D5
MAFFMAPYPSTVLQDSNGGFLGLFNNPANMANAYFPPTVAMEFDTFKNVWDPVNTMNHIGVDVNRIMSLAYAALPNASFNRTMSAWVRYDANVSTLSVTLRFDHLPELGLYNVSVTVDFKEAELPQQAAVGFSRAMGDFVKRHQILSWSFKCRVHSRQCHDILIGSSSHRSSRSN